MNGPSIIIRGIGSYVPETVLTNEDLSKRLDTSDEWIRSRSGIGERRIAGPNENTSDLGLKASLSALAQAGISADQIDLIVLATATPDQPCPATACNLQAKLGIENIPAFDVSAVCSGFIYALDVAKGMMLAGNYRHALVVGAEKFSSILDWDDRSTCVLFGDGAGALVLQKTDTPSVGLLGSKLGALGREAGILEIPAGGTSKPTSVETLQAHENCLKMQGREVFKNAVRITSAVCLDLLNTQKVDPSEIACIVPHQANIRIIESMANHMHIPIEKFFVNLDKYGNTSAASIPIALDEAFRAGRWKSGDLILLASFGAGLTWGATLLRWH